MGPFLHTSLLTVLLGTLLLGRCLPCANLPASPASGTSCCNKAGECQRVPSNSSNPKPCPLQQAAIATVETGHHHAVDVNFVSAPPLAVAPVILHVSLEIHPYAATDSPPHLFLLNSSFVI